MSGGFLPDLANWALRGGAGEEDSNENDDTNQPNETAGQTEEPLTEAEIRARRLARMGAAMNAAPQPYQEAQQQQPVPMDIDKEDGKDKKTADSSSPPRKKSLPFGKKSSPSPKQPTNSQDQHHQTKKAKESHSSSSNPGASPVAEAARKVQRRKELLLKKVLSLSLAGTCTATDTSCVVLDLDDTIITVQTIAEVLATRLSLSPDSSLLKTIPSQKPLVAYLAQCHRRASDELKNLRQSGSGGSGKKDKDKNSELEEILEEIKRQVVSYAASSLMEPDLFELATDGSTQLAKALLSNGDPTSSITFGVTGTSSSFYYSLCEELLTQDKPTFQNVIQHVASNFMTHLSKCESVDGGAGETSALGLVVALNALIVHKAAAHAVAEMDKFLVPEANTAAANELVRPAAPTPQNFLSMLAGENRPYKRRSGPAIEKDTLLGLCLRVGTPKNNPAFSPTSILRQSLDSVERATNQQRQQLRVYQESLNQLVMTFVKSGVEPRGKVMKWLADSMLVNTGASAMRPDPTKVSSSAMLLNVSVVLLKLCEPFVVNESKHKLIDTGFVSEPTAHNEIYTTSGDDAVPRLGEPASSNTKYEPKNAFIPQCFFLAARSLHLSIVPQLSQHENLLRHISHAHWELNNQNRDIQSDPHFCILVSKQRANEVALFQEELISDSMRFCNLMARLLNQITDETLSQMPEHFVNNVCDILMSVVKMKPKLLRGLEVRYVFKLVVKLLSPKYSNMVRNYNLRARLGDVLYELFLPSDGDDRRDVPPSVSSDPLAGGQTYLLSDASAQETLAPSLLLLYGEVEHTGYYEKMSHRAKISSLLKYLWESSEHRPAFRRITQNKESFIKFANGIMNETNTLIATVMQKLPEIRAAQEKMSNTTEWSQLSEEEQSMVTERLDDCEREVKSALPLCNKTLQMFGYLNTDRDIRVLFLLEELCHRLVSMLIHVLTKLVGSKGLELKVNNPEQYDFRPKEMLRDLCAIFALFASSTEFQLECAKSGCNAELLRSAVRTCRKLHLLTGESMVAFEAFPELVEKSARAVELDEDLKKDAPSDFMDALLASYMTDPVILPSGIIVDRSTITQHLLNDSTDPFSREAMTIDDVKPATELKERMNKWLDEKRAAQSSVGDGNTT